MPPSTDQAATSMCTRPATTAVASRLGACATSRRLPLALMLCLFGITSQAAHADVLNFDDLVLNVSGVINVPTPYHGVLWGTEGNPDLYAWGDSSYSAANSYGNSYLAVRRERGFELRTSGPCQPVGWRCVRFQRRPFFVLHHV